MLKVYVSFVVKLLILLPVVNGELLFSSQNKKANISSTSLCSINSLYTWQCNNGQCIQFEDLCDGIVHCADGSDETVEECLHMPCPAYAFKCTYGGCITGDYKCNGIVDCIDGSDENRYLCNPALNYSSELRGKCWLAASMECKSGECISSESACDGVRDCSDGSDETVEICSFLQCPEYSFRCGYGACVAGSAKCNNVIDCADGSDESRGLCGPDHRAHSTTSAPVRPNGRPFSTTTRPVRPTYLSTTTTLKPSNIYTLPPKTNVPATPATSTITYPTAPTRYPSVPHGEPGYPGPLLPTQTNSSVKYCSVNTLIRGISTTASCSHNNLAVSCYHSLRTGTHAEISCAPGYMRHRTPKPDTSTLVCDKDGEWNNSKFRCSPICGSLNEEQRESILNPWDVTILRRSYEPIYQPVCSGVIVSPKVVISAANCLTSIQEGYATDHVFYNIIEGLYNFSYAEGDALSAGVHNVSRITIQTSTSAHDLAILIIVNYFRFTNLLKPICLPSIHNNLALLSDDHLNIGRGVTRDTSRDYLEYVIAKIERTKYGHKTTNIEYIRINYFVPFIMREIQRYKYIL